MDEEVKVAVREVYRKRSSEASSFGLWLKGSSLPLGYTRLCDTPEVIACIRWIAGQLGSMTIKIMENGPDGDRRVRDNFARFLDVTPCPEMGTRMRWMSWIATEMLTSQNGSAFVLPVTKGGEFVSLLPMPGAVPASGGMWPDWYVSWRGHRYAPDEVIPFVHGADPDYPWCGMGLRVGLRAVADSLGKTAQAKATLSDPTYQPPLVACVDSDSDLAQGEPKQIFLDNYIECQETGKPWVIPGNLFKLETIRPLSISDIAIKDSVELDRKAVCSLLGVPGYVLGVSEFSEVEHNGFVGTTILPLALEIQQALTGGLILNPKRYVLLDVKSLYRYSLKDLMAIYKELGAMGYATGNEVRNPMNLPPRKDLNELRVLENYIPVEMSGDQKKLIQDEEKEEPDDGEA